MSLCELRFESLDAKLRTVLLKFTTGEHANKHRELSNVILEATDGCKAREILIRGRQLLQLIFTFYQVDTDERIKYDLMNITSVTHPGDAHMAKFMFDWNDMLKNMKAGITLDPKFLEVLLGVIRKSEDLRIHAEHDDRQLKGHPDRTCAYIHAIITQVVLESRHRANKEALLVDHLDGRRPW